MITKNKLNYNLIFAVLFCAVFCIYTIAYGGWGFGAYSLVYAVIPGYALCDIIFCTTDFDNSFLKLAVGIFAGIFVLFGIYFVLYPRPALQLLALKTVSPAICVLYAVICFATKRKNLFADTKTVLTSPVFSILAVFMLAMMCINLVFHYPTKASLDYQDYVWHISLVNSLASGHPFRYFNVQAGQLSYHYFSDLFLAIGKRIFGFDGFGLVVQLQPLFLSFVTAAASVGVFTFIFKGDRQKTIFACAALFACYGMGFGFLGLNLYNHFYSQFYSNVNAVTFSTPLLLLVFWAIFKALDADKPSLLHPVLVCISMFLLTGAKGPFGVVVTASFAFAVLVKTIAERKFRISSYLSFAGGFAGFFLAFTTFMGNASDGLEISAQKAFNVVKLSNLGEVIKALSNKGVPELASKIALTPLHFIAVTTLFGILFIISFFRFVSRKNKDKTDTVLYMFLLAVVIISCGGYYILFHKSTSQMYFLYTAFPALTVIVTEQLFRIIGTKNRKNLIAAATILIMALPMAHYQYTVVTQDYTAPRKVEITEDYIQTFNWIEQNTPADCIIATNRHNLPDGTRRWFYDAAYCDRQFYLSGYGYGENASLGNLQLDPAIQVNSLFFTDYDHKYDLAKNLNIGWLLIYKDEAENVIPYSDGFEIAFETSTTCVVKVL